MDGGMDGGRGVWMGGWERVGLHRCRHRDCHQMSSESKECGEKRGGGENYGVEVEIIERQKSQRSF